MAAPPTDSGALLDSDPSAPLVSSASIPFRAIIPDPSHPKIKGISHSSAASWAQSREAIPAAAWLMDRLRAANLERPFKGFTTNGTVREDLYPLGGNDNAASPGSPVGDPATALAAGNAAQHLVSLLSQAQKAETLYASVEQDEVRLWSNPELYVNPGGLRLDEVSPEIQDAVHAVIAASMSMEGYDKVWGCCVTNGFLGELVNGRGVLNEHSYNFRMFGAVPGSGHGGSTTTTATADGATTSSDRLRADQAWAYTFFGHHLSLAVLVLGAHIVIAPTFLGAEPDRVDAGPHSGLRLFSDEEHLALSLQQSLAPALQQKSQIATELKPGSEPNSVNNSKPLDPGRWNPFDERHLGGARQDNRILPYEGLKVGDMPAEARELVVRIWRAFNSYYPAAILDAKEKRFRLFLESETYWAWIGGWGAQDAFYYRIHGPEVFCELDFHCGIFLTNTKPARCHIHTINRLPNAGDYGRALLREVRKAETK